MGFKLLMLLERYLSAHITEDLRNKMVFIGGPRQVGKTTISLQYLPTKSVSDLAYLNWDYVPIRQALLRGELPAAAIVVLDEIHKYADWKNLLKGFFDTRKNNSLRLQRVGVTMSLGQIVWKL